jgi:hypothetical protein
MTIHDSYTNPPYWEYNWSEVDWDDPTPDDVCALSELTQDVRMEYLLMQRDAVANGTVDDLPRLTMYLWDNSVRKVGLSDSMSLDEDTYEFWDRLCWAGMFVHDDRKLQTMSEEELAEEAQMKLNAKAFIKDMADSGEIQEMLDFVKQKIEQKDQFRSLVEEIMNQQDKEQN